MPVDQTKCFPEGGIDDPTPYTPWKSGMRRPEDEFTDLAEMVVLREERIAPDILKLVV